MLLIPSFSVGHFVKILPDVRIVLNPSELGRDLKNRFGLGVGHLNYIAAPGVGIFEFLFVPMTTNHFPGWGISVIFQLYL